MPIFARSARSWGTLGDAVRHRCSRYLNNRVEQDHRGLKRRYYPMRAFGTFASAARFCPTFEEQRQYFRSRCKMGERVSLAELRRVLQERWDVLLAEVMVVYLQTKAGRGAGRMPSSGLVVPVLTQPAYASENCQHERCQPLKPSRARAAV